MVARRLSGPSQPQLWQCCAKRRSGEAQRAYTGAGVAPSTAWHTGVEWGNRIQMYLPFLTERSASFSAMGQRCLCLSNGTKTQPHRTPHHHHHPTPPPPPGAGEGVGAGEWRTITSVEVTGARGGGTAISDFFYFHTECLWLQAMEATTVSPCL